MGDSSSTRCRAVQALAISIQSPSRSRLSCALCGPRSQKWQQSWPHGKPTAAYRHWRRRPTSGGVSGPGPMPVLRCSCDARCGQADHCQDALRVRARQAGQTLFQPPLLSAVQARLTYPTCRPPACLTYPLLCSRANADRLLTWETLIAACCPRRRAGAPSARLQAVVAASPMWPR